MQNDFTSENRDFSGTHVGCAHPMCWRRQVSSMLFNCYSFRWIIVILHLIILTRSFYFPPSIRPGLLADISESLFAQGLSVEHVHTSLRPGKGGRLDFVSELDCVATSYMDRDEIREMVYNLGRLKELHQLEICDVRVQHLRTQEDY